MAVCSLATLQAQACANGFLDLDKKTANAAILQLLCNIIGGDSSDECVNLIPDGAVYDGFGTYELDFLLSFPATYQIIFGNNDSHFYISGGTSPTIFAPGTFQFTTVSFETISLTSGVPNSLVTATICAV
jgi:hypothetical protein